MTQKQTSSRERSMSALPLNSGHSARRWLRQLCARSGSEADIEQHDAYLSRSQTNSVVRICRPTEIGGVIRVILLSSRRTSRTRSVPTQFCTEANFDVMNDFIG